MDPEKLRALRVVHEFFAAVKELRRRNEDQYSDLKGNLAQRTEYDTGQAAESIAAIATTSMKNQSEAPGVLARIKTGAQGAAQQVTQSLPSMPAFLNRRVRN